MALNRCALVIFIGAIVLVTMTLMNSFQMASKSSLQPPQTLDMGQGRGRPIPLPDVLETEDKLPDEKLTVDLEEIMAGPLAQDDIRIINYIDKMQTLVPPSEEPYKLKTPNIDPSQGQSTVVKKIFQNMRDGFFVECGGLDGETRSNTLSLEKEFGWKGLLVEGDPSNFKLLLKKNRKAWAANVCLATKPYPHQVMFEQHFNIGKIHGDVSSTNNTQKGLVRVQCYPLFSLLSALKIDTVDYFSLDVEGNEYEVLENIPFDKILIKVLSVEYIHGSLGEAGIAKLMKSKGYRVVTKVTNRGGLANDLIFAHPSVIINEEIPPINT